MNNAQDIALPPLTKKLSFEGRARAIQLADLDFEGPPEELLGEMMAEREEQLGAVLKLLIASYHCLRSYEYGNASTELAKGTADHIKQMFPDLIKF